MPTTAITIDNELLSSVSIDAATDARDMNHFVTPFLAEQERVHGKGKPSQGSGARWVHSFGTGTHSNPTRQQTGYEKLDLNFTGVLSPMVLTPDEVVFPVGISAVEEDLNGGNLQTISLITKRTSQVMARAKRDFEKNMFQGAVLGFEGFHHLNGTDDATLGVLEEDTPGGQSNVIGQFSKSTWSALPGTQNQAYDIAGSFNGGGLTGLIDTIVKARARCDDLSKLVVFGSEAGVRNYKMTVQASERYVVSGSDTKLDATGMQLMIHGQPCHIQPYMPNAGGSPGTTDDPWTFCIVDMGSIFFKWSNVLRDGYFSMSDFAIC